MRERLRGGECMRGEKKERELEFNLCVLIWGLKSLNAVTDGVPERS